MAETNVKADELAEHTSAGSTQEAYQLDFEVGWDGPDDPENPLNWTPLKRWSTIVTVALNTLLSSLGRSYVDLKLNDFD